MSESQSRYSIVENLTKQMLDAREQITKAEMSLNARKLELNRAKKNRALQEEQEAEDFELYKKQIALDIANQDRKVLQLTLAISEISKISKLVDAGGA